MAQKIPEFKNILVIHFGQLGDVVLGLPALSAVREKFADAKITLLVGKSASEVTTIASVADEQITVDRVMLRDGNKFRSIAKIMKLVVEVKKRKFDLVIDLHSLYETNLLGFLAGIKHRLYANRENRSLDRLANFYPRPPLEVKSMHAATRYCDVLRPLDVEIEKPIFRFQTEKDVIDSVCKKFSLSDDEKLIGIFPGAGHPSRCWNIESFASLAAKISDNGFCPVVVLGPEEKGLKTIVTQIFPTDTIIVDGLSIAQFIALATKFDAFVTNDTGPMHLAACAGSPIVLLLDERAPVTYLPLTDKLSIVQCATIDLITVDEVLLAVTAALENDKTNAA